ncbi:tetratricopeptide repeat protein [Streptomyces sp. CA-249302]|uniref:tetratricopeptide repeat protein n=1 Tax=Streptomyces sp. CA-249302 TaxID=3240058 RepID=UPI003D8A31EC
MPLALSHAAAYMVNENVGCAEYLRRFNSSAARLDDLLPRDADTEGYGRQVAAALLLSLDVAQASEPVGLAVPVMRLAAVLDPAGHPRSLWASDAVIHYLSAQHPTAEDGEPRAVDPAQAQAALRLLHRYGLLVDHTQNGPRAVRLHAITARAVRECTPQAALPAVVKAATSGLIDLCEEVSGHDHETRAALHTNIDSLAEYAGDLLWQVRGYYLLRWAGHRLSQGTAVAYWQQLIGTSERLFGRPHPMTLAARRDLALALFRHRAKEAFAVLQEDFPYQDNRLVLEGQTPAAADPEAVNAIPLVEDTVTTRRQLLGWAHPATLSGQADLALLHWSHGHRTAAIDVLERSLTGYRTTLGPHHPRTISVDNRLRSWREQHRRRWWRRTRRPSAPTGSAETDGGVIR